MIYRARRRLRLESIANVYAVLSVIPAGTDAFCLATRFGGAWPLASLTPSAHLSRRPASMALDSGGNPVGDVPFKTFEDLEALTVTQLKSELKMRGLKQGGRKADLVRLLASTPGVLLNAPPPEILEQATVPTSSARVASPRPIVSEKKAARASNMKKGSLQPVEIEDVPGGSRRGSSGPSGGFASESDVIGDELAANPKGSGETESQAAASGELPRSAPQLPPATEDGELEGVIVDLLERREATFELSDELTGRIVPRGDVYAVYTKKAVRPWEGPHADRAETHVVVLLSDVFGWGDPLTRGMADQVADVCDAIVLVPDLFRKRPWDAGKPKEEYEAWRALHDPDVVAADIRACVMYAKAEYKPTSLGLMGFCYGGGRALEEAAEGVIKPDTVVVFCPTRYDVDRVGSRIACPVAAFFAEHDVLAGATLGDAERLREKLLNNEKVPDAQVKLCPGAGHGFVHRPMAKDKQNAEDAILLATSWLEMYMRKHFRVEAKGVKEDEFGFWELPSKEKSPT